MSKPSSDTKTRVPTNLLPEAHQAAAIACRLAGETLIEFLSKAAEDRAKPILKRHGVRLPALAHSQGA